MNTSGYFVGNRWREPASGKYFDSENPAIGEAWTRVPDRDAADVARAVVTVRKAYYEGPWEKMMPAERGRLLCRIGDTISRQAERIEAGTVYINNYYNAATQSPVGVYMQSGYGRENGFEGVRCFMQAKSVWLATAPAQPDPFAA